MNKRIFSDKGITLVALVVTIIVLLILAGVTISMVLSGTGILGRAGQGREAQERATIEEQIELGKADAELGEKSGENYFETLSSYLAPNNEILNQIARPVTAEMTGNSVVLRVGEKYVYQITRESASYLGSVEESSNLNVELAEGVITFVDTATYTTNGYTQGPVSVTITKSSDSAYADYYVVYAYSAEASTWTRYTEPISIDSNTTIYAKLTNGIGKTNANATHEISNIDTENPTNATFVIGTVTDTSIAVTASAEDNNGIAGYKFSCTTSGSDSWSAQQTSGSYTFSGLTANTTYTIKVQAIDVAGRTVDSESKTQRTKNGVMSISLEGTKVQFTKALENLSTNYGKQVDTSSFSSVEGVNWQLLYDDEDYIFLITKTPVAVSKASSATKLNTSGNNGHFKDVVSQAPYNDGVKSTAITENPLSTKYLKWATWYPTSTDKNICAVAYMMDTTQWANFAGTMYSGAFAIGGPTIELFGKSYYAAPDHETASALKSFAIYSNSWNRNESNSYGYKMQESYGWVEKLNTQLGTSVDMWSWNWSGNTWGWWLASPSANANTKLLIGSFGQNTPQGGYIGYAEYTGTNYGFRPVVVIPKTSMME